MAYTPTTWTDNVAGETPDKFEITDDVLGAITTSATIDLVGSPIAGTAYTAERFNAIEQGIAAIDTTTIPEILTAKGDLVSASVAGASEILNVGASGSYLIPDSGETSGLVWRPMIVLGDWTYNCSPAYESTVINAATDFSISANAKMILLTVMNSWNWLWGDVYVGKPGEMSVDKAYLYMQRDAITGDTGTFYDYASGWIPLDENGEFAIASIYFYARSYLRITAYMQ